ncbi:cell wall hydrolase [Roseomonas sp. GC11]|uniref:cell wall hydrolase n=1 Tax=Roseomonas sp. GC11 TaxID=2950546 RepID=UPI00210D6909|nr:cell wall hydrolase [Roseomonas sp. GC11]MCQ4158752.1 cell wall hydrolase [Roseomonas sp. GC11]
MNDLQALARTLYGEARGEGLLGIRAVASVILNRAAHPNPRRFGASISAVCLKPFQFSCWNQSDPNRPKLVALDLSSPAAAVCLQVAWEALMGRLADTTGGADHYHTVSVSPPWARGMTPTATLGSHVFYAIG